MNIIMKLKFIFPIASCAVSIALTSNVFADTTIASNGKSTFTIVIPAKAPTSVQDAAQELQKDVQLATGAQLSMQKDTAKTNAPIISLGSTSQAKAARISNEKIAEEAYRIVTKNGNLYIIGIDTPDGGWTKNNGVSNGTANGVYSFLEDYLDVRWLMPGEIGLDVPAKSTFTIADIDKTFTPKFAAQRNMELLTYYANPTQTKHIEAWVRHQRAGLKTGSTNWDFNHNWWRTVNRWGDVPGSSGMSRSSMDSPAVKKLYSEHPEWFAMNKNGKRPLPKNHYAKLETTNPELVKWFADQAIKEFETNERPVAYSLSPSDGSGWSLSPESVALYDTNPDAAPDPEDPLSSASMSSLVLKWYDDIAKIVAERAPGRMVTGFIYSTYIYPPQKVKAKLPGNFAPQIAPSRAYGYGLYREDVQKYFHSVMDAWAEVVTGPWFYYDLPSTLLRQPRAAIGDANFPGGTGIITPPAADNLNILFKQLVKSHINGANLYGDRAWSNAALANYIMAKLEWDPTLDANAIKKEWLYRAYGDAAGTEMEHFYRELDGWFRKYFQTHEEMRYQLEPGMLKDLFAAHYPEMEKLFLQASAQPMTAMQKRRLQLIEDNLIVLQWRLRNAKLLSKDFASPLQRSDAQISDLIGQENPDLPNFAGATNGYKYSGRSWYSNALPWKVNLAKGTSADAKSTFPQWEKKSSTENADLILLYAAQDGDIKINTQMVTQGSYFAGYKVTDQEGNVVTSGIFNTEKPVIIHAKAGDSYVLNIPRRKPVNYQLQIQNAVTAQGIIKDKTLTLTSDKTASVYAFYAAKTASIGVLDNDGNVDIRKPYSGDVIKNYISNLTKRGTYSEARLLETFDTGWLFHPDPQNDGIKRGVLNANFDDSDWTPISPLNWWQFQGFPDYMGPAWYRLKFQGQTLKASEEARIYFGAIDGNAEIYLNGKKIKEHTLGENYSGWDKAFTAIATRQMKPGENILAVKVTSKPVGSSGMHKPVALYAGVKN